MRVHELIEILQKMEPNAEVTVGSHTLKHNNSNGGSCEEPIGVWPAMAVETGTFPFGGPFGDGSWVKLVASDVWGCTHVDSQGIKRSTPLSAPREHDTLLSSVIHDACRDASKAGMPPEQIYHLIKAIADMHNPQGYGNDRS